MPILHVAHSSAFVYLSFNSGDPSCQPQSLTRGVGKVITSLSGAALLLSLVYLLHSAPPGRQQNQARDPLRSPTLQRRTFARVPRTAGAIFRLSASSPLQTLEPSADSLQPSLCSCLLLGPSGSSLCC